MRISHLGIIPASDECRRVGSGICAVLLFWFFVAVAGGVSQVQHSSAKSSAAAPGAKPAAPSNPAAAGSAVESTPAADPHLDEDTVDTTPATDETEDGSDPALPPIVMAPRLKADPAGEGTLTMPVAANAGGNAQRQQINNQCANLLFLAQTLKVQVDKSTMDELSVPVVRSASEIEKLARKMRDEMKPVLSSRR